MTLVHIWGYSLDSYGLKEGGIASRNKVRDLHTASTVHNAGTYSPGWVSLGRFHEHPPKGLHEAHYKGIRRELIGGDAPLVGK